MDDVAKNADIVCADYALLVWLRACAAEMPDTAGKWDVMRIPSIESGVENASTWQGAMFWTIPAKSANPELAWKFIEYTSLAYDDTFMQESMDLRIVAVD